MKKKLPHNELTRVQLPAVLQLMRLGYQYLSQKSDLFDLDKDTNIIKPIFQESFLRLNPDASQEDFQKELTNIKLELGYDDLGRSFFNRLQGKGQSVYKLIDWEHFAKNSFHVAVEVECQNGDSAFRPDITIFINGLPLSYIEVKQPNIIRDRMTGIQSESKRMEVRFRNKKFRKFHNITQIIAFSDNMAYDETPGFQMQGSYYASTSLSKIKFNAFREESYGEVVDSLLPLDDDTIEKVLVDQNKIILRNSVEFKTNCDERTPLNHFLTSLYEKKRLNFFLRYGIAYVEETNSEGQIVLQKHIMRYPQFFAARAIVKKLAEGVKKGIIWHTQGSGKTALTFFSLSYLRDYFQTQGKVARFYFIVDRLDLADQAEKEFAKRGLKVKRISRKEELTQSFSEDIAVVNIQKITADTDLTDRSGYDLSTQNIYFIDEAHRSYNERGSYLPNLYNADQNAIKIALTGTPLISYQDENYEVKASHATTRDIFGDYIHKYYYNQSIADGYTLRLMREDIETSYKEDLKSILRDLNAEVAKGSLSKQAIFAHPKFVSPMLDYILQDFEQIHIRFNDDSIGAMVVADSSEQARELYRQFKERQKQGKTQFSSALILYDEGDKDSQKEQREAFKAGKVDILFVYSMLLTGFDAPRLKKLYLGRKIKAHGLLQTLTRVNRPYKDFRLGYVVDFADISQEFDRTNHAYFEELTREYDSNITGEDGENVFGSIFVAVEEIEQNLREAEVVLVNYSTDDWELFSQEISEVEDRKELLKLSSALTTIKENYNLARLLNYQELLDRTDFYLISRLLTLVSNRLATMSLLDQADLVSSEELLNLAINQTEFVFTKVGEEELKLAANDLMEVRRRVASGIRSNWDQNDPEWLSLYEEFRRVLQRQEISEITAEFLVQTRKDYEKIDKQIRELNRKNRRLANKFKGDRKYARTYKRLTNQTDVSEGLAIYQVMKKSKAALDEKIANNYDIITNSAYFKKEAAKVSRRSMQEVEERIPPQIIKEMARLLTEEYAGELH